MKIKDKKILTFNVVFEKEKAGGYCVSVPSLPGCYSQGDTFEETTKNIQEAIELYLEPV
ncbi:type II toxin-antitoxin system HicB family antitoxin [Patescibacteria group bacterium]|nr:type II toxin-antitoxin system HicB family antitoxin [Patescibacteria group bacterium]MBU1519714.1 type II toxin-antitoxin system HicB family antitoxin [Patescibacteria group bacterium]MBU1956167.1 type II toxin-antitoxin system HicB family antitoxin [Patescibacteria group bacterium]MBU2010452.1 type II toxin-antitoxin system HicB family antitoxin [Patescibacteria group bacterium]MBU2416612.1 type II toxin-antitoxin system HicB family antitoxin [Patescibacteria group bacterium]